MSAILKGAVAGGLATLGMSGLMAIGRASGWLGRMPPEKITARALDALHVHRSARTQDALASLLHIGFGAAGGALFEPLRRAARVPVPAPLLGAAFGTLVWGVSYAGWVPALGIMPPPQRDRPGRPAVMLAAHWVYGGILGALLSIGGGGAQDLEP